MLVRLLSFWPAALQGHVVLITLVLIALLGAPAT
jgi:hypothetical protein